MMASSDCHITYEALKEIEHQIRRRDKKIARLQEEKDQWEGEKEELETKNQKLQEQLRCAEKRLRQLEAAFTSIHGLLEAGKPTLRRASHGT
jgi:chromosome segregation ATPase